jgi:hypothetical protein
MADVALNTGLLSDTRPTRAAAVHSEGSFTRGLLFGIVLSLPAWTAIAVLVLLLI